VRDLHGTPITAVYGDGTPLAREGRESKEAIMYIDYKLQDTTPDEPVIDPHTPDVDPNPKPYPVSDPPIPDTEPVIDPNPEPFPSPPEPIPTFPPDVTY
jgi:hypothetical protein